VRITSQSLGLNHCIYTILNSEFSYGIQAKAIGSTNHIICFNLLEPQSSGMMLNKAYNSTQAPEGKIESPEQSFEWQERDEFQFFAVL